MHFFLLLPLLDLNGADLVADRLLHVVVPMFAMLGWLLFGPRRQVALLAAWLDPKLPGVNKPWKAPVTG